MSARKILSPADNFNTSELTSKLGRPIFLADTAGPAEPGAPAHPAPPPQPPETWQSVGEAAAAVVKKLTPGRTDYTAYERALFAKHAAARAGARPQQCHGGESCWVTEGPPAMTGHSQCTGCGGRPR